MGRTIEIASRIGWVILCALLVGPATALFLSFVAFLVALWLLTMPFWIGCSLHKLIKKQKCWAPGCQCAVSCPSVSCPPVSCPTISVRHRTPDRTPTTTSISYITETTISREVMQKILQDKEAEISRLRVQASCNICLEQFSEDRHQIVFNPCGHRCCHECAPRINACHQCRKHVTNKVQVFA